MPLRQESMEQCPSLSKAGKGCIDFKDWVSRLVRTKDDYECSLWAALIAGIWRARNDGIFQDKESDVADIIEGAWNTIHEHERLEECNGNSCKQRPKTFPEKWIAPHSETVKINCDIWVLS